MRDRNEKNFSRYRESVCDEMARRWLRNPAELGVARKRKDGTPISFKWGKVSIRCEKVYERAKAMNEKAPAK